MEAGSQQSFIDYYDLLGVQFDTGPRQIRNSYLRLAKEHHPDTGGSVEAMRLLNTAYKTLINEISRAAYDKLYRLHNKLGDELELRDDYDLGPMSAKGDDELIDYYVDSVYKEYYQNPKAKKKTHIRDILKGFKHNNHKK